MHYPYIYASSNPQSDFEKNIIIMNLIKKSLTIDKNIVAWFIFQNTQIKNHGLGDIVIK